MSDLEFINTISSTFSNEVIKFIQTFTTTIKQQFEDVDKKVKEQSNEINMLKDELKNKKFDENNYTSVSVIKNQDKQIYELTNTIKTLENRIKYLELKNNVATTIVKIEPTYENLESNNNTESDTEPEIKAEIITKPIKKVYKRVSKKKRRKRK